MLYMIKGAWGHGALGLLCIQMMQCFVAGMMRGMCGASSVRGAGSLREAAQHPGSMHQQARLPSVAVLRMGQWDWAGLDLPVRCHDQSCRVHSQSPHAS